MSEKEISSVVFFDKLIEDLREKYEETKIAHEKAWIESLGIQIKNKLCPLTDKPCALNCAALDYGVTFYKWNNEFSLSAYCSKIQRTFISATMEDEVLLGISDEIYDLIKKKAVLKEEIRKTNSFFNKLLVSLGWKR